LVVRKHEENKRGPYKKELYHESQAEHLKQSALGSSITSQLHELEISNNVN